MTQTEPKRKPDLKFKPWSEMDLDRLSEITPEDIELAKAAVQRASPKLARMMDAKPKEQEQDDPTSRS